MSFRCVVAGVAIIFLAFGVAVTQRAEASDTGANAAMRITVSANGREVEYELNDSRASKDLLAQLPMTIKVENYGGIEKIFYPPTKLNTSDTPLAKDIKAGTLAYYAPWADVVMFYDSFHPAAGLYELGNIVSGGEHIESLSGEIRIEITRASDN
ncbi:MAG: hypothetical protein JJ900_18515 [Rhodospirillales bacterium]|nr:hypothetical protein [Rhodospirillales bacterium]MBO6788847.1 hypothetical protein [Rhodospirillales bacterium]